MITCAGLLMRLWIGWTWQVWDLNVLKRLRPGGRATIRATC